ncbi:MAG: class I SAM-dependent methyltransferase [Candidatus Muirbacterium halophilum]|nr:class I SAM-dependent methyltransferase [Candidatus Muirbacterium halophilum]MCK9476195.1 class I SAM-dependent methyltransferase [Candidatus Muirbacterium halophilum]
MNGILNKNYIDKRKKFSTFKTRMIRRGFEVSSIINKFINNDNIDILDLGCADGNMKFILEKYCYNKINYTGVEYNYSMISSARQDIICADIEKLPINPQKKFDVINLSAVLEHIEDKVNLINSLCEFIDKDGIIVITMPDPFFEQIAEKLGNIAETGYHSPLKLRQMLKITDYTKAYVLYYKKFMLSPYGFIFESKIERFYPDFLKLNQLFVLKKR